MLKIILILLTISISLSCVAQSTDIVINEFMAVNNATIVDEEGKYEDWIELYNPTDAPISLLGLYLTDNPDNITKWECPDVDVPANGYLLIWADEDGVDGELHANFKLSAGGESIHLSFADSTIVDEITFGEQNADIAMGRIPNGTGPFVEVSPTPNAINSVTSLFNIEEKLSLTTFPNPADEQVIFKLEEIAPLQLSLYDMNGRLILNATFDNLQEGSFNIKDIPNGLYVLNFQTKSASSTRKLFIDHNQ